jgi:hypothetical protein
MKKIEYIFVVAANLIVVFAAYKFFTTIEEYQRDSAPKETIDAYLDLTRVSLPAKHIGFLEYDESKDPRNVLPLAQIGSFSLQLAYPGMQWTDRNVWESPLEGPFYIYVSVNAGSSAGDMNDVQSFVERIPGHKQHGLYDRSGPAKHYGLDSYEVVMKEQAGNATPPEGNSPAKTVYYHRPEGKSADTYIECPNSAAGRSPCTMRFVLPEPLHASISIDFRKEALPYWHSIKHESIAFIERFRSPPDPAHR